MPAAKCWISSSLYKETYRFAIMDSGSGGLMQEPENSEFKGTSVIAERAHEQELVSSLISSGLETVHGNFKEEKDHESLADTTLEGCIGIREGKKLGRTNTCRMSSMKSSAQHIIQCNSNNNSNAEESLENGADLLECELVKKRSREASTSCHKGNIEVSLEGKSLWDEFYHRGTEMIVNRAGRRMFPGFSVSVSCLKPKVKYSMKLEVVLADNHRFKFLNSKWLAVGSAEPQPVSVSYLHPDSPNSGAFWMRHGVSFRKLKITNNKERPGNNALLYSMHKYFIRLIVEEEYKATSEDKFPVKVVAQLSFPETTFVAVTAYQNEEVTQLKITNNPFAKAFRENATDMDWEAAQMLYNSQSSFSAYHPMDHPMGGQLFGNGVWPLSSPLLPAPPAIMSASLPPPFSPLSGLITPSQSSSCGGASSYVPYYPQYSSTACAQYFQWPLPPPLPPPPSHHHSPLAAQVQGLCQPRSRQVEHSPTKAFNLPDFETVFTP